MDQARAALPSQLGRADQVLAEADEARSRARADAEEILADARRRAAALVEQESVVAQAQERAAQILRDAEEQARVMRHDADDYCDRRLADFEIDLGKVLSQVQAGRAKLAGRLDAPAG
jgi:F0F1-type ATP synthase membrane subunit b/b'